MPTPTSTGSYRSRLVPTWFLLIYALIGPGPGLLPAQSGDLVGPPRPVAVINTPANPIPVTGTVTGSITGNVSITNVPTVKIDSAANAVVVAPRATQQILNTGMIELNLGGYPSHGPFNVSGYSKVRVMAVNSSTSDGPYYVIPVVRMPGGVSMNLEEDVVILQPGDWFSRVYEVPGENLVIAVAGNGPNRRGMIVVFGN